MNTVTKEGEQPRRCIVEQCERPPASGDVLCPGHLKTHLVNGSATTNTGVIQPDDPELIERTARQAAIAEEKEYAERRRVKTWKTLETGARVPDEYFTDEELARIEAEVTMNMATANSIIGEIYDPDGTIRAPDPVKEATKVFKAALKGKLGELAREHAWSTVRLLADMR